mmetsp:Transcript_52817/g.67726  ORF Transcript_52817/g.67726 Transcript_52817/m.67726 type:complete len:80 (+) Transcript_52817:73-312(+)|eukprot:CAMPEP_0114353480 /NCGR_PEP_ID=MMETSP0101-20121206/18698_1 /TAXON_ID=38822 ORGANISM="Pteridomonas danica, Strain PT" /NCGR_SAMPLE_ID=MMETSP0101 /ASSEMBLY_ACC=CAM_ASM_000211 /LENGTH=79 /DNA_ID=CAMNT_0001494343 /DNA_START=34 /DNA_END=273 /DNA_ORIENTATION=+
MIYDTKSAQFASFMASGKKTPSTEEVYNALNAIKAAYPKLEATEMADVLRMKYPQWILDNLDWVGLQTMLDKDEENEKK